MSSSVITKSSIPYFFDPRTISGCQLWLDGADSSTLTLSGSNISQWRDKSSNVNLFSNGTTVLRQNVQNGLSAVYFSNVTMTNSTLSVNSSNHTTFIVPIADNIAPNISLQGIFSLCPPDTTNIETLSGGISYRYYVNVTDIGNAFDVPSSFSTGFRVYTESINPIVGNILCEQTSSGTMGFFINSTVPTYKYTQPVMPAGFSNSSGCILGAQPQSGNRYYKGHLCEIIIYNAVLTTSQRQQVEGYLAWKWGLQTSLPSNHPFRTNAPVSIVNPAPALPPFSGKQAPLYFDPRTISGCQLWLDAADSSTVTVSAGSVTQVNDKSGNGYTLTGGTGFTYPNNIFNGRYPSFYNAASTNGYIGSNISFSLSQPLTAFAVGQSLAGSGTFPYIMDSAPGGSSRIAFYYWNSGGLRVRLFAGGEIEYIGAASTFFNSYYANTTASEIFVNGTSVVSGSIGSGSLSRLIVGNAQYITGSGFIGHLCEVLFFRSVLPTTQRQQIEGYLAWKWGLQANLPSNHPYRNSLPTPYPLLTLPKPIVRGRFQPTQLTGLQLWLDAADASTLFTNTGATTLATLGQTIARWNDKSGNGNYAYQNTAGNRPTYTKSAVNALSLYFSTNSIQLVSISNNTTTGNSSRTVFAVSYSPGTTSRSLTGTGTHAGNTPPSAFGLDNSPATAITIIWYPYVYTAADNTQSVSVKNLFVHHAYYDASVSRIGGKYSFGNDQSKSTTLNTTASPWYFGNRPDGGGSVDSYFSEFLHYNRVLSPSEVSQIEGYLAWKWGLVSNLPSTHPFKLFPPPP